MPSVDTALDWIAAELAALDAQGLRRRLLGHQGPQGARVEIAGRSCLNFGSNDYLALAADPRLAAAARQAILDQGWGSGASPLVAGRSQSQQELERELAEFERSEAALVCPSGFAANTGTIPALVSRGDVIVADEMNHASLIDGCRLSRADVLVYPHGDWRGAESRLAEAGGARRRLIVTDSLFSMDGDLAPLAELADLAERYDAMLLVDEAHATGVFGEAGTGVAEQLGAAERVHVRIGTLSKALAGQGGFVCGQRNLIDWLLNRARPYVFSTALPAAACAAASAAVRIVRDEPHRRRDVLSRAARLRVLLAADGWDTGATESQIVPLVVGSAQRAVHLADALFQRGFYVPAIRPPSVPAGAARLRISVTAGHDTAMLDALRRALAELRDPR